MLAGVTAEPKLVLSFSTRQMKENAFALDVHNLGGVLKQGSQRHYANHSCLILHFGEKETRNAPDTACPPTFQHFFWKQLTLKFLFSNNGTAEQTLCSAMSGVSNVYEVGG